MSDTDHVEAAVLAAYDQYAPSVSEEMADRCALAFREGFLAGHAEAEAELRAENERLRALIDYLDGKLGCQCPSWEPGGSYIHDKKCPAA